MFIYILSFFLALLISLLMFIYYLEFKWSKEKMNENILETLEQKNLKKIYPKPTLEDGNCFYSAIYRSLLEKDLLYDISDKFNLNLQNETSFISSLRYFLSNHQSLISNYEDLFHNMISNFQDKEFIETFKYILSEFGDTRYVLIKFFQEKKFEGKYLPEFIQEIQKLIQMNQTFVGEIEVNTLLEIFKEEFQNIIFHNEEKAISFATNKSFDEKKNLLILLLENEHWTYL